MISCRKSTEWIIKKEHGKLSVKQNLQLISHLAICNCCRFFSEQSLFINQALINRRNTDPVLLSTYEKEEMLRSIQKAMTG